MAPAKGKIRAGREGAPLLPGFAPPAAPAPEEPVSCACGGTFLPVLYGRQNASMTKKAKSGEALLGGCVITNRSPLRRCSTCRKGDGSTMGQVLAKDLEELFGLAKKKEAAGADPT